MVPESALPWLIRSHIAAGRVVLPQGSPNIAVVPVVVGAQNRPDGLSCLLSVVVRHLREEVVCNMRVGDVVVQVVQNKAIVAVDGGERTMQPVPLRILAVGEFGMGVLQAGRAVVEAAAFGRSQHWVSVMQLQSAMDVGGQADITQLPSFDMQNCSVGQHICWMACLWHTAAEHASLHT